MANTLSQTKRRRDELKSAIICNAVKLDKLYQERDDLEAAINSVWHRLGVQKAVVASCRRDLKQFDDDLYWSTTAVKPWPRDIILKITAYSGIEDDICDAHLKGDATWAHVDQLVSTLRKKLHVIQHFDLFGSVSAYLQKMSMILRVESQGKRRWKTGTSYPDWASVMTSELFQPKQFTALGMTLTLFGHDVMVKISVGSPAASAYVARHENTMTAKLHHKFCNLRRFHANFSDYWHPFYISFAVGDALTITISYPRLPPEATIAYGGTPKRLACFIS
tara:strand:- start:1546 stop:2379 length:834 start_codon:yes stop_codon:yes gene_type:complete